jgi:hypothetical protein
MNIEVTKLYRTIIEILFIFALVGIYYACDGAYAFKITDYYSIYQNEFNQNYQLMCKMGCKDDAFIDEVKAIKWNKRCIQINTKKNISFLIIANKELLSCCNGDKKIGPFKDAELDSVILKYNIAPLNNNKSF